MDFVAQDSSEGLRIELRQSGGIAGGQRTASVDTADLHPEGARELEERVDRAGFFALSKRRYRLVPPVEAAESRLYFGVTWLGRRLSLSTCCAA